MESRGFKCLPRHAQLTGPRITSESDQWQLLALGDIAVDVFSHTGVLSPQCTLPGILFPGVSQTRQSPDSSGSCGVLGD